MRVLFAGGGTAGHVSPAIAIAEALIKQDKRNEVAFVGRVGGEENNAVISRGYKLYTVNIKGFSRKISVSNIKSACLAFCALERAKRIIKDFSPDVIVGTGGYVCWPVLKSGIRLGIPTALHESNIYPGLVTRRLFRKLSILLLNSDLSLEFLTDINNYRVVGNPVRCGFEKENRAVSRRSLGIKENEFFIVSFGGSLGAQKLNTAALSLMKDFSAGNKNVRHLHATGTRYFEEIIKDFPTLPDRCAIVPYIDKMPLVLSAADLVISRSGAMTITEIAASGTVSILIPSPTVADNHQLKNAKALSDAGAAVLIEEKDLENKLITTVHALYENRNEREKIAAKVLEFHNPHATESIVNEIKALAAKKPR